jgi:16S rRNA (uracil1498-N3)-methyltransferase
MKIMPPVVFNEAIRNTQGLALIPWEKEQNKSIREAISPSPAIYIFIGPEGGWDASEIELAERHRVIPVRLGPTLLRSETAGLVAATLVLAECGVYS